jgi:hypothetical protein
MEIESQLYRSTQRNPVTSHREVVETPVVRLVREINTLAEAQGLHLYRWESASPYSGYIRRATYGLHDGPRPRKSCQVSGAVVSCPAPEGRTERCFAYLQLLKLLAVVKN